MPLFAPLNKSALVIIVAAFLLFFGCLPVCAQKLVLLPLADISKGGDGVNFALTKAAETVLKQYGIELVSRNKVKLFMAANKVRSFRYLDSYMVKKLGSEFECALVLIGTVTEQENDEATIGLSFTALDTLDGNPVWSASAATGAREKVRAFAVGEAQNSVELARPLLKEMLAPLATIAHEAEISASRDFQLLGLSLFPGYVQGGDPVEATLKIRFLGKRPTLIAAESAAGKNYLQYDRGTGSYYGKWFAPTADGRYPVDLRIEWGREQTIQKVERVADYEVINSAPGLKLEIKKGIPVGQRLAMRDHILILPRLGDTRPLARWALEIKSKQGDRLVYEEHEGDIPERMIWEGRRSDNVRLSTGIYDIGLHIWDLAGNRSSAMRRLALQAETPQVAAEINRISDSAELNLRVEGHFEFPLTSWQAELLSSSGQVLVKGKGTKLPASLRFKPPEGETHALLSIVGEDLLGNRLRIKRQQLDYVVVEKQVEEQKAESWVPDF